MQALGYALDSTWRTLLPDLGIVPADVLRRAGLPDDLFHQPSIRLAPEDYYRLWRGLEAASGDPLLPLKLCEAIRSESFSPPLFAALCSANLLMAAQRIAQYKRLVGPMRLGVKTSGARVTMEFEWLDAPAEPPPSFVVMELLFLVALARIGTRETIRPVEITTTVLPAPLGPFESFVGARMRRGAGHQVIFSHADATRPFLTSNEPLWAMFEPELRQRLADLEASVTTVKRVQAALHEAIPSGMVTMEEIAARLALSKRTLQRRIEAEGTNFQEVLKETRVALAHHYLQKTSLPAAEISFLLGFDEPNSFYRAFRRWTGRTPDSVRHLR